MHELAGGANLGWGVEGSTGGWPGSCHLAFIYIDALYTYMISLHYMTYYIICTYKHI